MNIKSIGKSAVTPAYIGIVLLYVKLFFTKPWFSVNNIDITPSLILLLIVLVRVAYKFGHKTQKGFGKRKWAGIFWLYIVFETIRSFFISTEIALGVATVNVQLFLVYLLFIDFKSIRISAVGLNKVIAGLVYFAIINTVLVFYTFFFGKIGLFGEVSSNEATITRAFGLMGDQLPWFLSFFALHALYGKKKYLFLFFSIGILMGASVGATIVLMIASLTYLITDQVKNISFYLKAFFAFAFLIVVSIFNLDVFQNIGILQRFSQGDFASTEASTLGHRFKAITFAINNIGEKPLLGYQNYSLAMVQKYDKTLLVSEKGDLGFLASPNNQFLAVIADYGFVGLVLFILFIYGLFRILREKRVVLPLDLSTFRRSSLTWLTVFVIFNQSATWVLPGSFLWVLFCLIIAINYKAKEIHEVRQ